jgi:hypothetical protein
MSVFLSLGRIWRECMRSFVELTVGKGVAEEGRKVVADRKSVLRQVATVFLTGERVIADRETSVVGTSVVAALKNRVANSRM